MIYTVNRNPVIERIVTTASPIDLATIADVCDVDDFMEERPLFPAIRSRFRLLRVLDESLRLCQENLLSRPCLGLLPRSACQRRRPFPRKSLDPALTDGCPGQSSNDTARPHRPFIRHRKRRSRFACSLTSRIALFAPYYDAGCPSACGGSA